MSERAEPQERIAAPAQRLAAAPVLEDATRDARTAFVPSGATTARQLLALQGRVGNSAVQALVRGGDRGPAVTSARARSAQREPATDLLTAPETSTDLERDEEPAVSAAESSALIGAAAPPADGAASGAAGGSAGGAGGAGGSSGGGSAGAGSAGGGAAEGGAASGGGPAGARGPAGAGGAGGAGGAAGAGAGGAGAGTNGRARPTGSGAARGAAAGAAADKLTKGRRTGTKTPSAKPVTVPPLGQARTPVREPSAKVGGDQVGSVPDGQDALGASISTAGGAAVAAAVNAAVAFWDSMDTPTKIRTGLELTRPIPGLGLFTGLASDAIGLATDLAAVPKGNDLTTLTIGLRDGIALFGNVLGAAAAIDQELQDIISVTPLAPADAITASINEGLLGAKLFTDSATVFLDVVILAESKYNKANGPQDKATLDAWDGIFKSFEASILSDTITGVIDGLDFIALGFTNGQSTSSIAKPIATLMKRFVPLARTIVGVVLNEFSIHGFRLAPGLEPPTAAGGAAGATGAPAPAASGSGAVGPAPAPGATNALGQRLPAGPGGADAATDEAARLALDGLIAGLGTAYGVWQIADGQIGLAEDQMRAAEAQTRALIAQINGGRDPFIVIRDAAKQSIDRAAATIGEMIEMGQMAGEVVTDADAMRDGCDATLALLASMRVPDLHLPRPTGDSLLDEAEALAASMADQAFQLALGTARTQVDTLREELSRPVHTVREHATEIANFNRVLQETCTEGAAKLQAHIQLFSERLGHVQNFEQVIDLLLHELTGALGVEGGAGLADVRRVWAETGDALLWGQSAAQSVRAQIGTPRTRGGDDSVVGPAAGSPEPPADPAGSSAGQSAGASGGGLVRQP